MGSGSSGPMSPSTPSRTSYRLTGSFEPGGAGQTRSISRSLRLVEESIIEHPELPNLAREAIRRGADVIGGVPNFERYATRQTEHLEALFDIAEEFGLPVDVHVDFDADPEQKVLEVLPTPPLRGAFRAAYSRATAMPLSSTWRPRTLGSSRSCSAQRSRSASRRPQTSNTSGPLVVFRSIAGAHYEGAARCRRQRCGRQRQRERHVVCVRPPRSCRDGLQSSRPPRRCRGCPR
jgi:hypothetical protein